MALVCVSCHSYELYYTGGTWRCYFLGAPPGPWKMQEGGWHVPWSLGGGWREAGMCPGPWEEAGGRLVSQLPSGQQIHEGFRHLAGETGTTFACLKIFLSPFLRQTKVCKMPGPVLCRGDNFCLTSASWLPCNWQSWVLLDFISCQVIYLLTFGCEDIVILFYKKSLYFKAIFFSLVKIHTK